MPWIWPLPRLDGVHPSIVSIDHTTADGVVQIGYPDRTSSPDLVPVFAPQQGIITYAGRVEHGATLCLDHPAGWSTQLIDLEHVLALSTDRFRHGRKVRVRAGDVLGHVRGSLRIGFDLARLVDGEWATIDPVALIYTWSVQPWFAEPTSRVVPRSPCERVR